MAWEVEFTEEFGNWWSGLTEEEQITIRAKVLLLEKYGPTLPRPHADVIHGSHYPNLKELRAQLGGHPYRVLFSFLTRSVSQFCSLVEIRQETTAGTKNMCRKRRRFMRGISQRPVKVGRPQLPTESTS
jgi:hypothetical protein